MDWYLVVKTAHILSASVLFGTGMGIAFFMWRSRASENPHTRVFATRYTVVADYVFTLPAVIVQPLTGIWLIHAGGFDPGEFWLITTYALFAVSGICWLPVVWIQIQLKNMAVASLESGIPLPDRYQRLFRIWFLLGIPAFSAVIAMFALMVAKPV